MFTAPAKRKGSTVEVVMTTGSHDIHTRAAGTVPASIP
jgi:hypothetical protein